MTTQHRNAAVIVIGAPGPIDISTAHQLAEVAAAEARRAGIVAAEVLHFEAVEVPVEAPDVDEVEAEVERVAAEVAAEEAAKEAALYEAIHPFVAEGVITQEQADELVALSDDEREVLRSVDPGPVADIV